ncbi:TetR/AcrR family transcriptional regulator [Thalassospira lucentensis]|uniref:TetR/AcrR family transcriptional regulator n=1 Tax=Thalassospira lucentensis TaxID=168935 RepID=UPI00142E7EAD|nr:TetR/AcrR family transcriptional regulator [Thalassospira lucentensis]NIZ01748.1 TetR/AcrR family transcriptional regulator [Thalassospira lucentensis]
MALKNKTSAPSEAASEKTTTPRRRTQAERSRDTRKRVCEATLRALTEIGYERISTQEIAQRANVSRGALTHQFPTRNELIVAAFEYLIASWENAWPFNNPDGPPKMETDELIDVLWDTIFSPDNYMASLELMLASRLDDDLGQDLRNAMSRWTAKRDNDVAQMLGVTENTKQVQTFVQMNLCLLRGLAVHKSFDSQPDAARQILEEWKAILRELAKSGRFQ